MQFASQMWHSFPQRGNRKIRQTAFYLRRLSIAQLTPGAARRRIAAASRKKSLML